MTETTKVGVGMDRDALDRWMSGRDLMLISNRYFRDLTRQLANARQTSSRLYSENALLVQMLAECQLSLRAATGLPHVPTERLAELIRANLDKVQYPE